MPVDIRLEDIKTYSGFKADEKPLSFNFLGKEIKVMQILETKLVESIDDKQSRKHIFKVLGDDNKTYTLCLDKCSEWYVNLKP